MQHGQNGCTISPGNTCSSFSISSLWVIAPTVLTHKPQIYEIALMLSSPSSQCPIHHQVCLMLSTEYLFSSSTSHHIPRLLLVPAFLVSHLDLAVASYLPSSWLSLTGFACCIQSNLFKCKTDYATPTSLGSWIPIALRKKMQLYCRLQGPLGSSFWSHFISCSLFLSIHTRCL